MYLSSTLVPRKGATKGVISLMTMLIEGPQDEIKNDTKDAKHKKDRCVCAEVLQRNCAFKNGGCLNLKLKFKDNL